MKILYLVTKSNWGGAQKYVYDLATTFSEKGHEVAVAFGGHGELAEKLEGASIRTISLDSLVRDIHITKELKSLVLLYRILKKERPEVLHLNSTKAAAMGTVLGRILRIPKIVFTVHGAPFREDRNPIMRTVLYIATWLTCLFSHKVIAVSNRDAHDIGRMFFIRHKVTMVYNGIPFSEVLPSPSSHSRGAHLVTIGELTKNKGYMYGLEAVNELIQKGYDIKYTIEGEGEDRAKMESYIKEHNLEDRVTLLGRTLKTTGRLHEFDIFILPSIKEGLPYVLLEAGRAMMPVVTTITGGIPEIVRHEETGLLVRPKNPHQLANALERLITDKKYAKALGVKLHGHVVQNFSHAKMITQTAQVYGLIKGRN